MKNSLTKFFDLTRDIRYEYECYSFDNEDEHAKKILTLIKEIGALLKPLRGEIVAERNIMLAHKEEYEQLEELFKPTLERLIPKSERILKEDNEFIYLPRKYKNRLKIGN